MGFSSSCHWTEFLSECVKKSPLNTSLPPCPQTILRAARLTDKVSIHLLHQSPSCLYVFHLSIVGARFCTLHPVFLRAGVIAAPPRGKSPTAPALMKRCCFAISPARKSFTGR